MIRTVSGQTTRVCIGPSPTGPSRGCAASRRTLRTSCSAIVLAPIALVAELAADFAADVAACVATTARGRPRCGSVAAAAPAPAPPGPPAPLAAPVLAVPARAVRRGCARPAAACGWGAGHRLPHASRVNAPSMDRGWQIRHPDRRDALGPAHRWGQAIRGRTSGSVVLPSACAGGGVAPARARGVRRAPPAGRGSEMDAVAAAVWTEPTVQ